MKKWQIQTKFQEGGATETEAGSDLGKGFAALFELCKKAAEGDEMAELALGTLENIQLSIQSGLRMQQEIEAHIGILKAMTGGGAKTQEPKP